MSTLAAFLDRLAAGRPDAPALVDRDRPVSYAALAEESARLAGGLAALGIGAGDRVALWLPNLPAWLATFFACGRLGAIAVSVNTRFRSHEVADIVGRAGCKAIVFWPGFRNIDFAGILAGCDAQALARLEHVIVYDEGESAAPSGRIHDRPVVAYRQLAAGAPMTIEEGRPESGCVIFTTSGTTRAPKFVLHDQRTVARHAGDVAHGFGYEAPGTVVLVTAPLCGVFGFTNAIGALAAGRPLVMLPTFDAHESAQAVLRHRVTHTHASDEMIGRMLEAAPGTPAFPSVRFFGYAAFAPGLDLPRVAEARGLTLVGLYGMSECHALMARWSESLPLPARALAGGRPVAPEARVRARDPASGAIQAHGVAGELEIKAPSVMVGYYGDEAATRAAFTDDGFLRTGDLGYSTGDGGFVFLARLGDAFRLGGFLVSPAEIEDVLQAHPGVAGAQVVGVETPGGTKAFAFVIPAAGAAFDERALIEHCAGRIAKFKVPVRVQPIEAFPVTPGANATKIQKAKLRELAQAALAASAKNGV